jgi:hypothetical protein
MDKKMNKNTIDHLATFITEDPDEFNTGSFDQETFDQLGGVDRAGHKRVTPGQPFSHSDIKVNAQEREAQKRELADSVRQGEESQKFLSYIESIEHMSQSGLEY